MRSNQLKTVLRAAACAGAGLLLSASVSSAADVYLQAQSFTKSLPGGDLVPMWGFASCDATFTDCDSPDAPGPRIDLATTDTLTIHLNNTLTTPVSIIIPGQAGGGDPVFETDGRPGLGRARVRSLVHETAPGDTGTYSWSSLRPGTFLYQSGTFQSIQVPMGLYGALVVGPATGVACTPPQQPAYDDLKSCYDADALLLFSEIDPWQNQRVADAAALTMTTACVKLEDYNFSWRTPVGYPCTVDYTPKYFLINGAPYDPASPPSAVAAGLPGDDVLMRFVNAGLRSHAPAIVGLELGLIAEDGNPYPGLARQQSDALLPAGKTLDAIVTMPAENATYPLFDRFLNLTNDNWPSGGMLAYLKVGTGSSPPPDPTIYAVDDTRDVTEDTALVGAESVLVNDVNLGGATVSLVSGPSNGMLTLYPDGTFDYSPDLNFSGADGFTYSASLGGNAYPAQVTLNVSFVNDAPVAAADGPYVNTIGNTASADAAHGVLGNDSDPDGDTLVAMLDSGSVTLNPDGSFSGATDGFTYRVFDGISLSAPAIVSVTINPVANIALNVEDPDGVAVGAYRWLVQEDATYPNNPASPPLLSATQSTNFHKSYMPVVAQGCVGAECNEANPTVPIATFDQVALDPSKRYYVSILPNDAGTGAGHSIGGTQIPAGTSNSTLTVIVNTQPIPTAQLSVIAFEDNNPTNGVPDPLEPGLGGWTITLEDAGGRYGISGGIMSQDVNGNPLENSLLGTPGCPGTAAAGVILTCPDGTALIKNLPPAKIGVVITAPPGSGTWTQTSTIEGTKLQDNWIKAGEPPFLVEFGAPGFHAFIGFVNPDNTTVPPGPPGQNNNTITGKVTLQHPERAPSAVAWDSGSYDALAHTRAWVGLNSAAGSGPNITTVQAAPDGSFTIDGIPDGTYQLVIWDEYLDQIMSYLTVIVPGGGDVGNIPVPTWFGRHEHNVFLDTNEDGVRQDGEPGLPDQNVNLRFRDGTVDQTFPTDTEGFVPFDQVFPYGSWQVAEIDFLRFKPTGVTVTVDGGGNVDPLQGSTTPYPGLLNPQVGSPRTETGPVLLEGFQSMPSMTSIFEWGKAPYAPGENGGIAGIVYYASTRGENDPRLTVGDPWEPGIPGVKVRLYREVARQDGTTALSLVQEVETDSWDANAADITGCEGETDDNLFVTSTLGGDRTRCFDGVRNFEQVRPGAVFDGGYAFTGIPPGKYVVEVVPPPGYELYKEEDKNVDFGDAFVDMAPVAMVINGIVVEILPDQAMVKAAIPEGLGPQWRLAQPPCVGNDHLVPDQLSLFPGVDTYAPFAGSMRPLCDRKEVVLSDQGQAKQPVMRFLYLSTPRSSPARFVRFSAFCWSP